MTDSTGLFDNVRTIPVPSPWPFDDLEAAVGRWSAERFAALIGVEKRTICRWRAEGMTDWQADRAAIRCGTHPGHVWGSAWWAACDEVPA